MAFGTNTINTYPSYVIAGPVAPQMPYHSLNPQHSISNPASKSPPSASAPSQPFINQYAQAPQGLSMPSGMAPYGTPQMVPNQPGQAPANWAEFIPNNQVSTTNGIPKNEGKIYINKKFP